MVKSLTKITLLATALAYLAIVGCKKHEHPAEHPAEHPEGEKKTDVTKDELADAIEAYVNKTAAAHGGFFLVTDDKTGEQLRLTLDKVHRKRLSKVGAETYFACADFKTPQGKIYDLDVFMTGPDKNNLSFTEFMIHKEAGKERYTWYEQGGVWKRKSLETAEEKPKEHPKEHPKEPEHPEHPQEHPK